MYVGDASYGKSILICSSPWMSKLSVMRLTLVHYVS